MEGRSRHRSRPQLKSKNIAEVFPQEYGSDLFEELYNAGAIKIGSKKELIPDPSIQKDSLVATFDMRNQQFLIKSFIITRIIPLLR